MKISFYLLIAFLFVFSTSYADKFQESIESIPSGSAETSIPVICNEGVAGKQLRTENKECAKSTLSKKQSEKAKALIHEWLEGKDGKRKDQCENDVIGALGIIARRDKDSGGKRQVYPRMQAIRLLISIGTKGAFAELERGEKASSCEPWH